MSDRYQEIRDRHEIELAKQLTSISRKQKRIERIFKIALLILIAVGCAYFYYVCFN